MAGLKALWALSLALTWGGVAQEPPAAGQDDCAAADDQAVCASVSEVLSELFALSEKPYEIPKRLPPLQDQWKAIQKALAASAAARSPGLEEMLKVSSETLTNFPDVAQYRFLVARARKSPCWFRELLKDGDIKWDEGAGRSAGAFVWAGGTADKAPALVPPDQLLDLYRRIPAPPPPDDERDRGDCASVAARGEPSGFSQDSRKKLAGKAVATAKALALEKGDAAPAAPAAAAAAVPPPPHYPGMPSVVDRAVAGWFSSSDAAFREERLKRAQALADQALILLGGANGDPQLGDALKWASTNEDPAARAANVLFLLSDADRRFEEILGLKLDARLRQARLASCRKAHKRPKAIARCAAKKASDKEVDAAREAVFTDDPTLGLYFIGRAEYQDFLGESLAKGLLPKGSRLYPWEVGRSSLPEGTSVVVDGEPAAEGEKGGEYFGLRFAKDGSSIFEGLRRDGAAEDYLVFVKRADGSMERTTQTVKPGKRGGPGTVVSSADVVFDAQGNKVRSVTKAGGTTTIEDFNVAGKYKGEPRRVEKDVTKGAKTKTTIKDTDARIDTTVGFDGAFTVKARPTEGLPLDPKSKDAPADKRWTAKKGQVKGGREALEEIDLENKTVLRGETDAKGRFLITVVISSDGVTTTGKTDPDTLAFEARKVSNKDGSGTEKIGRVTIILGPGGTPAGYQLDLADFPKGKAATLEKARAAAEEFASAAGLDKRRAGPLAGWLFDQLAASDRDALLASKDPAKAVEYLVFVKGNSPGKQWDPRSTGEWALGTEYKGSQPQGRVLLVRDDKGLPRREYLAADLEHEWVTAQTHTGDDQTPYAEREITQHTVLVEYRRDASGRWGTSCHIDKSSGDIDLPCDDGDDKPSGRVVVQKAPGNEFLNDIGGLLDAVPGVSTLSKWGSKAFYAAAAGNQRDFNQMADAVDALGVDDPAKLDRRMAVVHDDYVGCLNPDTHDCEEQALASLRADPELLARTEEKVLEVRKKDPRFSDECTRRGESACDAWIRSARVCDDGTQSEACREELLSFIGYAESPQAAVAEGGVVARQLGHIADLGEKTFSNLPIMVLTEGLGLLGDVKYVGQAAGLADRAVSAYFMSGFAVGEVGNTATFVKAVADGDSATAVDAVWQAGMDAAYLVVGGRDAARKEQARKARKAVAAERVRLEALEAKLAAAPPEKTGTVLLDLKGADQKKLEASFAAAGVKAPAAEGGFVRITVEPAKTKALLDALAGTGAEPISETELAQRQAGRPAAPVAEVAPPEPPRFLTHDEVLDRFGGVDPRKAADAKSETLGGMGGGRARLVEINGEKWVVKARRAVDAETRAASRRRAQNELLGRELVRRFFPEFDTPEGLAYQDGDWFVSMSRYEPGAKKSRAPWKDLSAPQRAALSILHEIFGVSDMNYGNILFGGDKPVVIDFEAIGRKPVDSADIAGAMVKNGWAPFVDRDAYNDPAAYKAEGQRWAERFADSDFQKALDEALEAAGLGPQDAADYKELVKTNLANYEENIGHYLDAANGYRAKGAEEAVGGVVDREDLGKKLSQALRQPPTLPDSTVEHILVGGTYTDAAGNVRPEGVHTFDVLTDHSRFKVEKQPKVVGGKKIELPKEERKKGQSPYEQVESNQNADGTATVRFRMKVGENADGTPVWSTEKTSTLFPKDWTTEKIKEAVEKVSRTKAVQENDEASLHRAKVDGVEIEVIVDKKTNEIATGYPTGGKPSELKPMRPRGPPPEAGAGADGAGASETIYIDLKGVSEKSRAGYDAALKELGIAPAEGERGLVALTMKWGLGFKLVEKLLTISIEPIDQAEFDKRAGERTGFSATDDEIEGLFAANRDFRDEIGVDLRKASAEDLARLTKAMKVAGAKMKAPLAGLTEIVVPSGKGVDFAAKLKDLGFNPLTGRDYAAELGRRGLMTPADPNAAGQGAGKTLWDVNSGAKLTSEETIKKDRQMALDAAEDPTLQAQVIIAEQNGEIAPADHQGKQGAEANCVSHALANMVNAGLPQKLFTLKDVMDAARKLGIDPTKGMSPTQVKKLLPGLVTLAAERGYDLEFRSVPERTFLEAGGPRKAGVAAVRTGSGDAHGLHAVVLRGGQWIGNEFYFVVTDSHRGDPLLYTHAGWSAALVSNGILVADVSPAKAK